MATDNYTFVTADSNAPSVTGQNPANNGAIATNGSISFHIVDSGTGVNLANTVIYVNGTYYTNTGGPGSVTVNGTLISFATSLNFNGGNYPGDTTVVAGTPADYTFTIKPQTNFTAGTAVPVVVYSRDLVNNLMQQVIYAPVVSGGSCSNGSTFCGANTSWDTSLLKCTGTGGGSCGSGGGGGGGGIQTLTISNVLVLPAGDKALLVTWYSSIAGSGRVVYDIHSPISYGTAPNYNYTYSTTVQNDNSIYHSVIIRNLKEDQIYYLRPITVANGNEIRGPEVVMTTEVKGCIALPVVTPPRNESCPAPSENQNRPNENNNNQNNNNNNNNNQNNNNQNQQTEPRVIYIFASSSIPTASSSINVGSFDSTSTATTNSPYRFPEIINSTIPTPPNSVSASDARVVVPFVSLLGVIGALVASLLRMARPNLLDVVPKRRFTPIHAIGLAAIFFSALATYQFNSLTHLISFPNLASPFAQKKVILSYSLSGRLVDPLTLHPVGNVDVATSQSSEHLSDSGQFQFSEISPTVGITVTDPSLVRSVNYKPDSPDQSNLYFNSALYNRLVQIVNTESIGQGARLYDLLPDSIKNTVTSVDYAKSVHTIFDRTNLTDQSIVIKSTQILNQWSANPYNALFDRVLEVTIEANGKQATYYFTLDGKWSLIK
jgi:hypothetical protein